MASSLGVAAAGLDAEAAIYQIGLYYNVMLPQEWRSRHGVFYTPPELANRLIEQVTKAGTDWATCRALDPACGGGAFIAPLARVMLGALAHCDPAIRIQNIAARLRGFELDPFAAWLSQVTLDAVMLPDCQAAGRPMPSVVSVCDSLATPPEEPSFDLVVGNPPYGRVGLTERQRAVYRRGLYGHANLYGLFTDLALRHTKPDGIVALVTPTSFLAGGYFKNLRALLGNEAPPVNFDFVEARKGVFEDVLQETLLAVYRKDGVRRKCNVQVIGSVASERTLGAPPALRVTPTGTFELPHEPAEPWLVPRSVYQSDLIVHMAAMSSRLRDWGYKVSTGPLVWNRYKDQLTSRSGKNALPLIWAEAVTSEGKFLFRAEKRNHAPWFRFMAGDEWLIVREPCVIVQRTTAKEQRRRLLAATLPVSFLKDHGGAVVENHLNMVRPLNKRPPVPVSVVSAFLNSTAADLAFRCVSGSVAVSAYELEALPLPHPEALKRLKELVRKGAGQAAIDAECRLLYNLPDV